MALFALLLSQVTMSLAGTTGSLVGTIVDATTKAPIAGAKVTAVSPSQSLTATSDSSGRFVFLNVAPDSYTVSAEKEGLQPVAVSGVNVFADQQQTTNLVTQAALRTIGRVSTRARSELVQPGTTVDAYTITASTQHAAAALGGGGSLNQAYSGLASVPGVYVPQGQSGIYQSVYIRGGDYTQLGYEFDGIPIQRSFDQYPSTALSSLGQQNLQVYAGSGPLDAQSSGLAGFINQVIKTGSYPSFLNANVSLGSPTFYHHSEIEFGGASKNRNFSYYLATAGYNQEFRYLTQQNGAQYDAQYGTPYNLIAANCGGLSATVGCYGNDAGFFNAFATGPNGYALGPFSFGFQSQIADRESVVNLHFGLPHKDGSKDDIQLLYDNSYLNTIFQTGINDWNYAQNNVVNGTATYNGVTYPDCATAATGAACGVVGGLPQTYADHAIFTGPVGVALTPGVLGQTRQYLFPNSSQNRLTFSNVPAAHRDTYDNRASIEKIQYTKTLGANAFARLYGYSFYSDWLQNGPDSNSTNFAGGVSGDYELLSHSRGLVFSVSDQVNHQNLLNLNAGYTYASTVRWNNSTYGSSNSVAYAVSSANPANGICYGATGAVNCGAKAYRYVLGTGTYAGAAPPLAPAGTSPDVNAIGGSNCGGAPCEYFIANNGVAGSYNTVAPRFTNLAFEDRFKPNDKLLLSLGVHYDDYRYDLTDSTVPQGPLPSTTTPLQRQFWINTFINSNCQNATTLLLVAKATPTGACPAGTLPVTFSDQSPPSNDYHGFEPRFAATYTVDPLTVLRASYSKVLQAASSAYQQYNGAAGAPPLVANFYPVGFRSPAHTVYPEESFNTDFSIEHQLKGSDTSFSITPFFRSTNREILSVVLDPKTGFVSGLNVGKKYIEGAELAVKKGDFNRDGISAQLSYTYTNGRIHFDNLPNGQTIIGPINTSIQQYNGFTSFCATHGTDPRCGGAAPASPCYSNTTTGTGAGVAACGPGDVANPYWSSPVQNLFDPNAFYTPYNQTPGAGYGDSNQGVSSSYIIPHVASLLLQYKHGPFRFTPSMQFSAGGKYGSPLLSYGVDPSSCGANLASIGAGVANDPRYTNGLPGSAAPGNAYLAQTCAGTIFTPNKYTGHFDNFGQFTEPSQFVTNLQFDYQVSKRVSFSATFANVIDQCFGGGKYPWANAGPRVGCWYATPPTPYAGNFYNPGNTFQGSAAYPYGPVFGNVFQSAYGGQANPFQAFFSLNVQL